MDVLIVGAGTMGRWFADCVADVGAEVAFADRDPDAASRAAEAVGATTEPLDPTDGDRGFDAVCLAVPISAVEEAIGAHARRAERAVFDVSGVMAGPVAAMKSVVPDRERASLHPLFAPQNEPGNVALVAAGEGPVVETVRGAIEARGNHVFETTPGEHDRAMETVQASAHAAVLAYALASEPVPERFHTPLSGPLEELVEQVTDNTPRVYGEIQETFPGAEAVAAAARRIADADGEAFAELYREAGARRHGGRTGRGQGEKTGATARQGDAPDGGR